jgi:hypothetical protein
MFRPPMSGDDGELMNLARFWSKHDMEVTSPRGQTYLLTLWRGSANSVDEALSEAKRAVERLAERVRRGEPFPDRYAYADRPMREKIVEEMYVDERGAPQLAITRNAYGALVLNSADVCFVDVDLPQPPSSGSVGGFLKRLFGRTDPPRPDSTLQPLARLRQWMSNHPDCGVRVYRTTAGLRYLFTHDRMVPDSSEAIEMMRHLGADANYIKLCRIQKSFRARLTPKPWRCRMALPPVRFPYIDARSETMMARWEEKYLAACQGYATCALIEEIGSPCQDALIGQVIATHDQHTRAGSGLPLA